MKRLIGWAAVGAVVAGCATSPAGTPAATATMEATKGNAVTGTVDFVQKGGAVFVVANVSGLPTGPHGFHIHDKGDCSSGDGMSAGGHFNPGGKPHGSPLMPNHHAGDMPMLLADTSGKAILRTEVDGIAVGGGGPTDVVGRAVIIHKDPDDYMTQPTGNSGARLACGVIRRP
jgi:superoxide dismutase, Cu-Zn family